MREDHCGNIHRKHYGKSDKANAVANQNADFQEGYAWGIETFAYHSITVLKAEIEFRGEFTLTDNGFSEITLASAERALAKLEADYQEETKS